jgi:hypothetical protein
MLSQMIDKREKTRAEVRSLRALAKSAAADKTRAACERVAGAVDRARLVLADEAFIKIVAAQGAETLPKLAAAHESKVLDTEYLNAVTLQFVIAWKFFFPFFANPVVTAHLDSLWPGLVSQLKDTFIALVVEGPFPHAMSGHRGRRRGSRHHRRSRHRRVIKWHTPSFKAK